MRVAWLMLAAGCGLPGCTADPEAGTNARTPVQPSAGAGATGGFVPPGTSPNAGGQPAPSPVAGSAAAPGPDGGVSAADAGSGPGQPAADAGPEMPPFCDDVDAGAEQGSCVAIGDFRVQHRSADTDPLDNAIRPHFNVWNDGDQAVSLDELTLRYWFTREGTQPQVFWCDYAQLGCERIRGAFVPAEAEGADHYLEISFTSGTLAPSGQTGEIQARFNKEDWSVYDERDDHSYEARTAFADAPKVTLYRRGVLAWGIEPRRP
jgi:hypothetical protein